MVGGWNHSRNREDRQPLIVISPIALHSLPTYVSIALKADNNHLISVSGTQFYIGHIESNSTCRLYDGATPDTTPACGILSPSGSPISTAGLSLVICEQGQEQSLTATRWRWERLPLLRKVPCALLLYYPEIRHGKTDGQGQHSLLAQANQIDQSL